MLQKIRSNETSSAILFILLLAWTLMYGIPAIFNFMILRPLTPIINTALDIQNFCYEASLEVQNELQLNNMVKKLMTVPRQ